MTSFRKTILFTGNFAIKNKIIRKIASFERNGPHFVSGVTSLPVLLADSKIFCIDDNNYASLLDDVSNNLILYGRGETNLGARINYDIKNHHNYCTTITNNDTVTSSWNIHDDNNQPEDIMEFLREFWYHDFITKSSVLPLRYYNLIRYIIVCCENKEITKKFVKKWISSCISLIDFCDVKLIFFVYNKDRANALSRMQKIKKIYNKIIKVNHEIINKNIIKDCCKSFGYDLIPLHKVNYVELLTSDSILNLFRELEFLDDHEI